MSDFLYKKPFNVHRFIISAVCSFLIAVLIYSAKIRYTNLPDFVVGITVFDNVNKEWDKLIPFIYLAITLLFYYINWSKEKIISVFNKIKMGIIKIFDVLDSFINKIKWDYFDTNPVFKIIIGTLFVYIIVGQNINVLGIMSDDYHFGEKLVGNWLVDNLHYKLYIDFFPAHGLVDLATGWLGKTILGTSSVASTMAGFPLFNNICLIIFSALVFAFLPFNLAILVALCSSANYWVGIYFLLISILASNKILRNNPFLWLLTYFITGLILYVMEPTFGAPYVLCLVPAAIYILFKYKKQASSLKFYLEIAFLLCFSLGILGYFHDYFFNNFMFIYSNFKYNLAGFGNYGVLNFSTIIIKSVQYFLMPLFLVILIDEFKNKEKNISNILLLSAAILYPIFIATYSLGRLDGECFSRVSRIGECYWYIFIPVFLYLNISKYKKTYNYYLIILFYISLTVIINNLPSTQDLIGKFYYRKLETIQQTKFNNGNAEFDPAHLKSIEKIDTFLEKNCPANASFLNLTNRGTLYYYLQKPMPIPFLAYYNIASPDYDYKAAAKIQQNLPDVVLISADNIMHDNLALSLRSNAMYRTLLLSNRYKVVDDNGYVYLLKTPDKHTFTRDEISILDNVLAFKEINFLPDAWGSSMHNLKTLLKNVDLNYSVVQKNDIDVIIKFDKPVDMATIDLMSLKNRQKCLNYKVIINNTEILAKSKRRERLIPLDLYPSVLLNKKITQIEILSGDPIEAPVEIVFYKKIRNLKLGNL